MQLLFKEHMSTSLSLVFPKLVSLHSQEKSGHQRLKCLSYSISLIDKFDTFACVYVLDDVWVLDIGQKQTAQVHDGHRVLLGIDWWFVWLSIFFSE